MNKVLYTNNLIKISYIPINFLYFNLLGDINFFLPTLNQYNY